MTPARPFEPREARQYRANQASATLAACAVQGIGAATPTSSAAVSSDLGAVESLAARVDVALVVSVLFMGLRSVRTSSADARDRPPKSGVRVRSSGPSG